MRKIIENMKQEWRRFRHDEPGERFINHYERAQKNRTTAKTILRFTIGLLLLAGGVFLWFVPGPGWLFVFFGLAMFASEWKGLAKFLDRVEVKLREWFRKGKQFWKKSAMPIRVIIVVVALAVTGAAIYLLWNWWFGS